MDEQPRIVLIPRIPDDPVPDVVFQTHGGFAVQATEADVTAFRGQGIAVVDLYSTVDDYISAIQNLGSDEANAAVQTAQNQALATLDPSDRNQFPVA